MAGDAVEIAKLAIGYANVGGIDIPVDLPGDLTMRYLYFSEGVSHLHQFSEGGILKQEDPLLLAQEFKSQCLSVDLFRIHSLRNSHAKVLNVKGMQTCAFACKYLNFQVDSTISKVCVYML